MSRIVAITSSRRGRSNGPFVISSGQSTVTDSCSGGADVSAERRDSTSTGPPHSASKKNLMVEKGAVDKGEAGRAPQSFDATHEWVCRVNFLTALPSGPVRVAIDRSSGKPIHESHRMTAE